MGDNIHVSAMLYEGRECSLGGDEFRTIEMLFLIESG